MSKGPQTALELKSSEALGSVETALIARGVRWVIGVDEAGRGPLAGPVGVAAVALDLDDLAWMDGVDDSKKLKAAERDGLFERIQTSVRSAIVMVEREEIDELNILWASMEGMRRAVEAVRASAPELADAEVLVDGNRPIPGFTGAQRCLIKGDARSLAIAAASVLAKVSRDREMVRLDGCYPGYGFAKHKGYPTAAHRAALQELGACPAHRRSFAPVQAALAAAGLAPEA